MGQNQSLEIDVPASRKVDEAATHFMRTVARSIAFIMELLDKSPRLHRLAWACIATWVLCTLVANLADIITAVRWW